MLTQKLIIAILKNHSIPYIIDNGNVLASNMCGDNTYTDVTKYSLKKLKLSLGY